MTGYLHRERDDDGWAVDAVTPGSEAAEVDHGSSNGKRDGPDVPEALDHLVETDVETRGPDFLGGTRPFDVDAEHVAQDGAGAVEGEAAEEENEEGEPLDGFENGGEELLLLETMTEHGECEG